MRLLLPRRFATRQVVWTHFSQRRVVASAPQQATFHNTRGDHKPSWWSCHAGASVDTVGNSFAVATRIGLGRCYWHSKFFPCGLGTVEVWGVSPVDSLVRLVLEHADESLHPRHRLAKSHCCRDDHKTSTTHAGYDPKTIMRVIFNCTSDIDCRHEWVAVRHALII